MINGDFSDEEILAAGGDPNEDPNDFVGDDDDDADATDDDVEFVFDEDDDDDDAATPPAETAEDRAARVNAHLAEIKHARDLARRGKLDGLSKRRGLELESNGAPGCLGRHHRRDLDACQRCPLAERCRAEMHATEAPDRADRPRTKATPILDLVCERGSRRAQAKADEARQRKADEAERKAADRRAKDRERKRHTRRGDLETRAAKRLEALKRATAAAGRAEQSLLQLRGREADVVSTWAWREWLRADEGEPTIRRLVEAVNTDRATAASTSTIKRHLDRIVMLEAVGGPWARLA